MKIWPMFCKACGQGIDRGDKFCRNCGVPLPQEPIESAVAASASAATTGEVPLAVASSTAALQRPLPIPKALLAEAASAAGVEEKPAATVTASPVAEPVLPIGDADKTAAPDRAREQAQPPAPEQKPEAADAAAQKATEPKSEAVDAAPPTPTEPKPAEPKPAEPKTETADTQAAPEKKLPSPETPAQPVVPAQQAQAVATSGAATPAAAKPDDAGREAGARPVRLCPHCHRLVGEDDRVCEHCKARLDQPAPTPPPPADEHYGVPSFAGYAAEPAARKAAERAEVHAPDPSGVDAIANLRIHRRRGLSVVETLVAVILLAGAGMAVWMLRSSLPSKTSAPALSVDVTISPARAKVAAGHGYDFAATVTGTDNYNVDWSIDEGDAGGRVIPRGAKAKDGAVSSLAVYMAPKTPGTYHVTATSKADSGKSASAIITVTGK